MNIEEFKNKLKKDLLDAYSGILGPEQLAGCMKWWEEMALSIRSYALEEAAKACEAIYGGKLYAPGDWPTPEQCAAVIRALNPEAVK